MKEKNISELIIRKGTLGENDIVAFDLTVKCNNGYIWCIDENGGSEAIIDYYYNSKKINESEAKAFLRKLKKENKLSTSEIKVRYKLTDKDKKNIWNL